jgi:hypothetical protein
VLVDRRDDIAQQLASMSGVTEALAEPERDAALSGPPAGDEAPMPENCTAIPEDATNHLTLSTNATTGTR